MSALPVGNPHKLKLRPPRKGDTVPLSPNLALELEWTSRVPVEATVTSQRSGDSQTYRLEPRGSTPAAEAEPARQAFSLWTELGEDAQPVLADVSLRADNDQPVEGVRVGAVVV